jgi:hypothetical protein
VRLESALALQHWFGIKSECVTRWRRILGVPKWNPGSVRLRRALNQEFGARCKGKKQPAELVERQRQIARAQGRRPPGRWDGKGWTADQFALLGTIPDEDLARKTGRTTEAVRHRRTELGIPKSTGWAWTDAQLALLGKVPDAELAAQTGRTVGAVRCQRTGRGIPSARDRRWRENR